MMQNQATMLAIFVPIVAHEGQKMLIAKQYI